MSGQLVQIGSGGKRRQESTARLILTLTVAGLFSGIAIVGAYELTRPAILANQARALREAVFEVVPGAEQLLALVWRDGMLAPAETGSAAIYAGYDADGGFLGYAIPGEGAGYQDVIKLIFGFDPERGRVVGMRVLESRETPGLGDKIYKDQDFVGAFRDLAVEPAIELVKDGATEPYQVDGITGATISSRAVVNIIGEAHGLWRERLFAPGEEPPYEPAGGEGAP